MNCLINLVATLSNLQILLFKKFKTEITDDFKLSKIETVNIRIKACRPIKGFMLFKIRKDHLLTLP